MKKIVSLALALTLALSAFMFAGCSKKDEPKNSGGTSDDKTITVGASSTPHAEILEQIKD